MTNLIQFNKEKIKKQLNSNLKKDIILKIYSEVDSTNNQAKSYIKNTKETTLAKTEKTLIFAADSQDSGRGRKGSSWFSNDPAGISMSFLFKIDDKIKNIPQVTAAAALAVNKTLKHFNLQNTIKWPNDILVSGKKIAGILSELIVSETGQYFVVIGCGINLNNESFSTNIKNIASSYYLKTGKKISKNIFLANLIQNLNYYIRKYFSGERLKIIKSWKKEIDLKNKKIDLVYKGEDHTVVVNKILNNGKIKVKSADNQELILDSLNTSLDYKSLERYN